MKSKLFKIWKLYLLKTELTVDGRSLALTVNRALVLKLTVS